MDIGIVAGTNTIKYNTMEKYKNILVDGAISATFIADKIKAHQIKTEIGAHSIFLGQVRADLHDGVQVKAIEYTCYDAMVLKVMHQIREKVFKRFKLSCLHVYHSTGIVSAGEICLFVFTSSLHRKDAMDACEALVEMIKSELPIWGKEIFSGKDAQWKVNG